MQNDPDSESHLLLDDEYQQQLQLKQLSMFKLICKQLKTGLKIYIKQKLTSVISPREKHLMQEFCNNMYGINLARCLQFCVEHTCSPKDLVDNIRSGGNHVTSLQQFRVTSFVNQYISYGKLVLRFNNRFKLHDITQNDWVEVFHNIQNRVQWVHSINSRFIVVVANGVEVKLASQKKEEAKSPDDLKQSVLDTPNENDSKEKQLQDQLQETMQVAKSINIFVYEQTQNSQDNIFAQLSGDYIYDILICGVAVNESDLQRLLVRSLLYNVKTGIKLTVRYPMALKTLCGNKIRINNLSECVQLRNMDLLNGKLHFKDLKCLTRLEKVVCNGVDFVGEKNTLAQALVEGGSPLEYLYIVRCRHGLAQGNLSNDSLRRLNFACGYEIVHGQTYVLSTLFNGMAQEQILEPEIEIKQEQKEAVSTYDEKQLICGHRRQPWKLVLLLFIIPFIIAMKIAK